MLGCVLLNQIQKHHFSGAFYCGIPIVGLWLVLGLGMGLGLELGMGLGLELGLGLSLGLGLGFGFHVTNSDRKVRIRGGV